MAELFIRTFKEYGPCKMSPDKAYLPGRYCWKLSAYLDSSFAFIVKKPNAIPAASELFLPFFGGYSDAEGSWCIYNDKGSAAVAFVIESKDERILRESGARLAREGFHPLLYCTKGEGATAIDAKMRLEVRRRKEVGDLAQRLPPLSRHQEKTSKMKLVIESVGSSWTRIEPRVKEFKKLVKSEVVNFTRIAEIQYNISREITFAKGSSARL